MSRQNPLLTRMLARLEQKRQELVVLEIRREAILEGIRQDEEMVGDARLKVARVRKSRPGKVETLGNELDPASTRGGRRGQ